MSKKRDARIQRKLAHQLKQRERTARTIEVVNSRSARSEYLKEPPKQIRLGANPGSIFHMLMRWTIDSADREDAWTWGVHRDWGEKQWTDSLEPKLLEFQKLTWSEIESQTYGNSGKRHRSHHSMDTDAICAEAKDRLGQLERDFPETLFRFRLGNIPRLWGVRIVDEFQILWYDPTHKIYPLD